MRFFAPTLLLTAAAVVSAQDELCDGLNVLELCLQTTTANKNTCTSNDYNCLCEKTRAVFGCFGASGCNDDPRGAGINSEMQSYCVYVTTTAAVPASTTASSASEETNGSSTATEGGESPSSTEASGSSSPDDTSSGAYLAMNAGGMMAAVAGVVVAIL